MSESSVGVTVQAVPPVKGPESAVGRTVYFLIGLNLVVQIALAVVTAIGHMNPVSTVRLSLVVGLVLYASAGFWIRVRATTLGVRPTIGLDTALAGAAEGVVVGGGSALFMVAVLRAILGHPVLDPAAALLAADGTVGLLVLGVLVIAVMAPLVEELIFRGFMAEAFRSRGRWEAIIFSMIAFSLAHLRLAELRYYMFLGMALAVVYLRRGLIGSVCAHAAFNGVLIVVAVAATHGPAVTSTERGPASLFRPPGPSSAPCPATTWWPRDPSDPGSSLPTSTSPPACRRRSPSYAH